MKDEFNSTDRYLYLCHSALGDIVSQRVRVTEANLDQAMAKVGGLRLGFKTHLLAVLQELGVEVENDDSKGGDNGDKEK